jgi:nickel transport protein
MRAPMFLLALAMLGLSPSFALAHGVQVQQQVGTAVSVTFLYDDQTPMAFERFDVLAPGSTDPFQTGRTDRLGRVVFQPDSEGEWQVRVWTEDGHGGSTRVQVDGTMLVNEKSDSGKGGKLTRLILAPFAILGLFYLISLIMKKL